VQEVVMVRCRELRRIRLARGIKFLFVDDTLLPGVDSFCSCRFFFQGLIEVIYHGPINGTEDGRFEHLTVASKVRRKRADVASSHVRTQCCTTKHSKPCKLKNVSAYSASSVFDVGNGDCTCHIF
jgi:hypothetical protein